MKSTFEERISAIIADSKLNKSKFAERIGVSQAYISQICSGTRYPSDRTISDICREFKVNEEWLREGVEPIYHKVSRQDEIAAFMNNALHGKSNDFKQRLVSVLARLDESEWELLEKMALKLMAEYQEQKPGSGHLNIVKAAGRDGSKETEALTDGQVEARTAEFEQLRDASEDL